MKLVKQSEGSRLYALNKHEGDLLESLLRRFPMTGNVPVKISKTDADRKTVEREKLLNESLAEHRKELKQQALNLLAAGKFKQGERGYSLTLRLEEREVLLQILNDIRVGCWRALGEPETLEQPKPGCSVQELMQHSFMNLAGYFEHHLVSLK